LLVFLEMPSGWGPQGGDQLFWGLAFLNLHKGLGPCALFAALATATRARGHAEAGVGVPVRRLGGYSILEVEIVTVAELGGGRN